MVFYVFFSYFFSSILYRHLLWVSAQKITAELSSCSDDIYILFFDFVGNNTFQSLKAEIIATRHTL